MWVGEGRDSATLQSFYELLGTDRCAALEAVSMDLGNAYKHATDLCVTQARHCVDPFHLVKQANEAIDKTRAWAWKREQQAHPMPRRRPGRPPADAPPMPPNKARWIRNIRWALVKDLDQLTDGQLETLH